MIVVGTMGPWERRCYHEDVPGSLCSSLVPLGCSLVPGIVAVTKEALLSWVPRIVAGIMRSLMGPKIVAGTMGSYLGPCDSCWYHEVAPVFMWECRWYHEAAPVPLGSSLV